MYHCTVNAVTVRSEKCVLQAVAFPVTLTDTKRPGPVGSVGRYRSESEARVCGVLVFFKGGREKKKK
jgi:hypothetical protein